MALLTGEGVTGTAINVDTVDGRVTLHGKVATQAEKQKAEDVAKKITGVKDVRNLIAVVPESASETTKVADDKVMANVKTALSEEKALSDSAIAVQSVNDGTVLLGGTAKTMSDHLRALEITRSVPGVRQVATEVQSPDRVADAEIHKSGSTAGDAPAGGGTMSTMGDAWTTSLVKMRLLANSETPAMDINVDTRNGVVTLFGIVPTESAKNAATTEARKVDGVKEVRNDLQVVAKPQQAAVEVKDDELSRQINEAMKQREALNDSDINVEVKNGVARLTGTVPSQDHRVMAAIAARSIAGVKSVKDELTIKPQG
jgi:hyperosmotically inducible protein